MPATLGIVTKRTRPQNAKRAKVVKCQKVVITAKAKWCQKQANLSWPMNEKKKELEFLQLNLNYADELHLRLDRLRSTLVRKAAEQDFRVFGNREQHRSSHWTDAGLVAYITNVLADPLALTIWWAIKVNEIAWEWPNWNGKLLNWVLNDGTDQLQKVLFRHTADYMGDGQRWNRIRKLLSADNKAVQNTKSRRRLK